MKNLISHGLRLGQKISKGFRKWLKDKMDKSVNCAKSVMQIFAESLKSLKSLMQIFATSATYASANFVGKESNESTVMDRVKSRITTTYSRLASVFTSTRIRLASLICLCMLTIGVGNAWGAAPTTSGLNFGTPLMSEDFNSLSTCENTPGNTGSGTTLSDQTAYGIFTDAYVGKSSSLGFGIYTAATPFTTKYLKLLGDGTKVVTMYVKNTSLTTTGAYDICFDKTKRGYFGLYSAVDNSNTSNKSYTVAYCYWDGTTLKISDGNSSHTWQPVETPTSDLIRVTVIYNASTGNTSYGSGIGISAQKAHVYINGTAVSADGTNPTEFTIQNRTPQYFRLSMNYSGGFSVDDIKVYNALPTAGSCTAPSSVTVAPTVEAGNYGYRYTIGETIKLTATASGGTGSYSYQWQKYVGSTWTDLSNGLDATDGGTFAGVTTANLQISGCTSSNTGSYRCVVSTGATCSLASSGYMVYVYTLDGNYYGSAWTQNAITWTGEKTGTVTINLNAKQVYEFKIRDNDAKEYGSGAGNYIIQSGDSKDCGTGNVNVRLLTAPAGNYTFTIDITNAQAGSPYVNVVTTYPTVSHPNSAYVYVQKFGWRPYLHYWYDGSNALTAWGSDPQINSDQYVNICGTDYWYVPVINYYCNFIAKDAAGDPSNTTGDQHTNSPHPGQRLYNDGTWKWADFTTYTISFEGGTGSTGSTASVNGICPGTDAPLTANGYSKTGYQFDGWTPSATVTVGSTTYTTSDVVPGGSTIKAVGGNLTMTAHWAANTISITLDRNNNDASGSTSGSTSIKYDATAVLSSPTHASRTGYTLEGYYAEAGCTHKVMTNTGVLVNYTGYVESGQWKRATTPTTLYANWTIKSYTVTWMVEGTELTGLASGLTTVNHGSKVTGLPSPNPSSTCDGEFVGWATNADGVYDKNVTDNYTTAPTVFTTQAGSPTITGDITFYAVFKKRMED